ncbi:MAG TPA: DUF2254 domain-containing protein [Actinomycetota bacterium]|nr:DUF2254 domain-containing protein [Actinomycetota bacterium]
MGRRLSDVREILRGSLWFVPAICVASSILLAHVLTSVDRRVDASRLPGLVFGGGPDAARDVLSTVAAAMMQFTAVVFTITIVVLQLASTQFSPRVLRQFLRDRTSKFALAAFVSTFTFSLVVLRSVRSEDEGGQGFVPEIAVTVSLFLVLVSVAFFIHFINNISQSIRVVKLIEGVAAETRKLIEKLYPVDEPGSSAPSGTEPPGERRHLVQAPRPGVVSSIGMDRLIQHAQEHDCCLVMRHGMGDFVCEGEDLVEVYGGDDRIDLEDVSGAIGLHPERTMQQDPAFGFRQLVDIAERALSPGVNDPTTAVQALDQMHDLLRRLVGRPFPTGRCCDEEGKLRLVIPVPTWEEYVALAIDEIRLYARNSIQVLRRLTGMVEDLLNVAPPDRAPVLEEQLKLIRRAAHRELDDERDRRFVEIGKT